MTDICESCKRTASSLYFDIEVDKWVCKSCYFNAADAPYIKEVGRENPYDKKGSTAHVRDIKNRRYDPKARKMFYYEPPKTYFFQKG